MTKLSPLSVFLFIVLFVSNLNAQKNFSIVSKNKKVGVFYDKDEAKVVALAADILVNDIFKITQKYIEINGDVHKTSIMAGTVGQSDLIGRLVEDEKIKVSDVEGKWETYKIEVIDKPLDGIDQALVIVGSDRRATAYGLLEVSRMMGISPWEWWADVIPETKDVLSLDVDAKIYGAPSVKYRGVFLDHDDWGLQQWAALNYDSKTGAMGTKTYAKIFELLLRLRANTIWPSENKKNKSFYAIEENRKLANDYAIVVGSSHLQPMLTNVAAEWNEKELGGFDYEENSRNIKKVFKNRIKETEDYEAMFTLGLGSKQLLEKNSNLSQVKSKIALLQNAINDEQEMIGKYSLKENKSPTVFMPFKESLDLYQSGLILPSETTLMWTDDHYGYIRQLSNPSEQKRTEGAGVLYHTSYSGKPHDYLWLNSTNPTLMWEEMSKAYEFNARNLWILNSGDIKPHEYTIELFLDMAWDMSKFKNSKNIQEHRQKWAVREFGQNQAKIITDVLLKNDELAFRRRPEFMAWSKISPISKAKESTMIQYAYGDEVDQRIKSYDNLISAVDTIIKKIPTYRKDAFYQLVYYPVVAAASINHKWLYAYKNKFVASQGRNSALFYGEKAFRAYNRIVSETDYYNHTLQAGKWNYMMNMTPRHLPVFTRPTMSVAFPGDSNGLGLALEGQEIEYHNDITNAHTDKLPVFNAYTKTPYFIDVFLKDETSLKWEAKPQSDWIRISKNSGTLNGHKTEERLWVSIDWGKVSYKKDNQSSDRYGSDLYPSEFIVSSAIDFVSGDKTYTVGISVFHPEFKELEEFNGFVEDNGLISIYAENPTRTQPGKGASWTTFHNIGYTGKVMVALPRTATSQNWIQDIIENSPLLEYDFYTFNSGEANVHIQAIPTHPFYAGKGVRCAVAIDNKEPIIVDFEALIDGNEWEENVLNNAALKSIKQEIEESGKHTLKIWMVDPGVMIDQVLIDFGGWKKSYAFPKETILKNID